MKARCLALLLSVSGLLLTGCSSLTHLFTTGVTAGGGALIAGAASHGDPAITAAGAVGGVVLGESIDYFRTKAEKKAFAGDYDQGRSDAAKAQYWLIQRQQAAQGDGSALLPIPVPAQEIDGIKYQATTQYLALPK